jgi:competence protein ComFC
MNGNDYLRILTGSTSCLFCGKTDRYSIHDGLCLLCHKKLEAELIPLNHTAFCHKCGVGLLGEECFCIECREEDFSLFNKSLFPYKGPARDLIHFYKFRGYKRVSRYFAQKIDLFLSTEKEKGYTLVPVPPAQGKIFNTGWDQIDLIVKILKNKGWKRADLLLKKKGKSQKSLNRQERAEEAGKRFILKDNIKIPPRILIIDDVFTTGSTLKECYRTLSEGGADNIRSLTIARD